VTDYSEDVKAIGEAIAHGVAGDVDAGLALIQPLVDRGPRTTCALLGSLAETAAFLAHRDQPGVWFGTVVERIDDGSEGSVDSLPRPLRFAAQFVTAWANGDRDTAYALFKAIAEDSDTRGLSDLADGVAAIYGMAIATATEVVKQRRAGLREKPSK